MFRVVLFFLLWFSFTLNGQPGFREGKRQNSFVAVSAGCSVHLSDAGISCVYYSFEEHQVTVSRIDIAVHSPVYFPGDIVGQLKFDDTVKSIFSNVVVKDGPFVHSLSLNKEGAAEIRLDENLIGLMINGAYALVERDGKVYFLGKDILYPAPFSDGNLEQIASLQLNIPFIKTDGTNARWSTFSGGTVNEELLAIRSNDGLVYVCGSTQSSDLPASPGSYQDTLGGYYDGYISCYGRNGLKKWTTYIGGTGLDIANSLTIDPSGNCIAGGYTNSPDFPRVNSVQGIKGSYDGFIVKIDSSGNVLHSGFWGATGADFIYALSADKFGNLFIGGGTTSQDLPVSSASAQPAHAGAIDAFAAKLGAAFETRWCTYLGGAGSEDMHAMTTDDNGNVIFCGGSYSPDFPVINAFQNFPAGGADVYIAKLDSSGAIVFSTFYGGSSHDDAFGVTCDQLNDIYITGYTPGNDLQLGNSSFQNVNKGGYDSFILKLSASGEFRNATYFGGTADDQASGITFGENKIFLCGSTFSTDIPVGSSAVQALSAGGYDGFYAVFDTSLSYVSSSYFGGNGTDMISGIAYDSLETFYLCGKSTSNQLPFFMFGDDSINSGAEDGFLSRITFTQQPNSSTEKSSFDSWLCVYPVPSSDRIIASSKGKRFVNWRISSLSGVILKNQFISSSRQLQIDIDDLPSGVYILSATDESQNVLHTRFVKD